jgi:hypothetical protein
MILVGRYQSIVDTLVQLFISCPHLYHAMFNTEMGESCTATMLVECVQPFERD